MLMTREQRIILTGIIIIAAVACLVLGLTLPVVRLSYLYFWSDTYSLVEIVSRLLAENELFLAAVIFLFSIIFPALKLVYLLVAFSLGSAAGSGHGRVHQKMSWLGKWSMLDVLVLALVVFYAKSSQLADAVALPGVYLFTASVVLTMLAYALVEAQASDTVPAGEKSCPLIESKIQQPGSVPS